MGADSEITSLIQSVGKSFQLAPGRQLSLGEAEDQEALIKIPACPASSLGDRAFSKFYGVDNQYVSGSMANGISSEALVEAMASHGMLSFFGAAGLLPSRIDQAIGRLQSSLVGKNFGVNLIHSPSEAHIESETVDLFLKRNINIVEASAFLDLTLPVVKYRLAGLSKRADGSIRVSHRLMAKVSRIEVAEKFLSPAPEAMVRELLNAGAITSEQAELAKYVALADDLTAEANSGGHTDARPLITMLPTMIALRNELARRFDYQIWPRVGAAGGLATPYGILAAFSMGAAYVVTGTINQACCESGTSDEVRQMLAKVKQGDTAMAAAADMFEMGVKVQVIKSGTLFPMRANKLFEIYRSHASIDEIPSIERQNLEKQIFRKPLHEIWQDTLDYFSRRDPDQIIKAEKNPKHKMALIFRWYLGQASRWANQGVSDRKIDYQVWAGPAMGAFNQWVKGTYLQEAKNRKVVTVAKHLLYGACYLKRLQFLKMHGFELADEWQDYQPREDMLAFYS